MCFKMSLVNRLQILTNLCKNLNPYSNELKANIKYINTIIKQSPLVSG